MGISVREVFIPIFLLLFAFSVAGCKNDDKVDVTGSQNGSKMIGDVEIIPPEITAVYDSADDSSDHGGHEEEYYDSEYEDGEYYEEEYVEESPSSSMSVMVIDTPPATVLGQPDAVTVIFNTDGVLVANPEFESEIPEGLIMMTPPVKGGWFWYDSNVLKFRPTEDWPADQEYKITFDKKLFDAGYILKNYTHKFRTPLLSAHIESFRLYQPPVSESGGMAEPFATATIAFSHPVSQDSVKSGVTLQYNGKPMDVTVMFDSVDRYAYIKTAPIRLQQKAGLMTLTLKSATTASGKSSIKERLTLSIDVPSSDDFFKVNNVYAGIVRNTNNEPEQVFTVDFTVPVAKSQVVPNVLIYKLPRKYDNSTWYNWRNYSQPVTEDFLRQFPAVALDFMAETAMENIQAAKFFVSPKENVQLGVLIKKGTQSKNGYVLNKDYFRVLDVPQFPTELRFTQDGTTLTMTGDKTLTFMSRGVNKVKVKVARIMPSRLNHLMSQISGDLKYASFRSYSFDENDISDFFEETINLDNSNPAKLNYFSFNLGEYLTNRNAAGVFIIEIFRDSVDGFSSSYSDRRLIQITDLGIIMKQNLDRSKDVYVVSLQTGDPVPQADVYYLARNGTVVSKAKTTNSGMARLPENPNRNKEELEPVAVAAAVGQDYTFMPLNQSYIEVYFNRFDVGGIATQSAARGLKGYLFTERGVYRPGDPVHIGVVVKQDDWKSLAGIPMELTITNPRNQQVLKRKFTMNDAGFSEIMMDTEYTFPTGVYNMTLNVVRDDSSSVKWDYRQLGSRSFKIEEFKPDTMKINARITGVAAKGWLPLEGLKLNVSLNNLFGRPAQNREIKWLYQMTPDSFYFSDYRAYVFTDPYREKNTYKYTSPVSLPPARTDDNGLAGVALDLSSYSGGLYRLIAQAEGFEDGSGDSVVTNTSAYVSPLKYLVGYKSDSKFSYITKGSEQKAQLIAINPNLEKIDLADLRYTIIEKSFVSLLVRQRDGTYAFQSMPREKVVKADKFQISKSGTDFPLDTSNPGNFQLAVTDSNDMMVARIDYFVSGSSNLTLSMDKNTELSLKLDKAGYSAGDMIELSIIAPYAGSGLITIEKDRVYSHKWFTTNTTSAKQTIQVPYDLEGNGYVNVSFIRSPDSKEIFMNPYTYAIAPFSVDRARHTTNITLDLPEEARPGEPLKINYKAGRSGKMLVYAVDEGILQVTNYQTPDPLSEFMRKSALQVRTYQTLSRVLSDNRVIREVAGIGGDAMDRMMSEAAAALAANLNPFKRKTELPVVFWSGIFDVEAGESSHVTYNVPSHFNGTLRVMAVAASESAVGVGEKSLLIRAPIIVQPSMPVNMAPGDRAGISVTLSNNMAGSPDDTPIDVEISSDEYFEIIGDTKKQIKLSEGFEGRVDFEIVARNNLGSGTITFKAGVPAIKDSAVKITATASVRPATAYNTVITTGVSEKKNVVIKDFSREMYAELSFREATASHSPLLIARGLTAYLVKYPHGCTEQITSQAFPSLYLKGSAGSGLMTEKESQEYFQNMVVMLRSRQLSNGGFTLWPGGWAQAHPYATVYAMHYLTDAKSRGYFVPQDLMDGGIKWLRSYTSQISANMEENRVKAYAAYILTRNGVVTTAFITNLEEYLQKNEKNWKTQDIAVYMAAIYKMLQMDDKAMDLIRSYVPDTTNRFVFFSDFDSSSLRNSTYLYIVGKHFPEMIGKIDNKIVMNLMDSIAGGHYSSILSSYSILALYALAESTAGMDEGMRILMDTAAAKGIELKVDFSGYPTATYEEAVKSITAESRSGGTMGLFLVATEQGFDKNLPDKVANGIEIQRDYLDENGKIKTTFSQGDDVIVRLRTRTNGTMKFIENTAIIDLLPGAFEIQSDSVAALQQKAFSGSYSSRLFDYVDVREDRLVFYAAIDTNMKEFVYKARVSSRGEFVIPPAYANSMYDPVFRGNTAGGKVMVKEKSP